MINKLTILLFTLVLIVFGYSTFKASDSSRKVKITKSPFINMSVSQVPINYKEEIKFKGFKGEPINLSNYNNDIYLLNFWATWCTPCKKEMPSLDKLQTNFKEAKIFPINIDENDLTKSKIFFKNLEIKNLQIYFDEDSKLANMFWLRGIPSTIILNRKKHYNN